MRCFKRISGFVCVSVLALMLTALTGCISTYSNTARFSSSPHVGMTELEVVQKYGAPDFAGFIEDLKVYVYKVRDSKFIIGVGQYSGHDLVIITKGGVVKSTQNVPRGQSVTFLHPAPWMGMD